MTRHQRLDNLSPFGISTSKEHYVVMQCQDETHAKKRYAIEETHRGKITSIRKVE